ncbi:MAG: serine hydrolase domain-containing protein [Planctomycetota bacterium JB042]
MPRHPPWPVVVLGVLAILGGSVAVWVVETMPPDLEPDLLPSQVLAPPAAEFAGAVEGGRRAARDLVAWEKLPGLSLAVAVDGEVVWAEGFRYADLESRAPMTPSTRFRIGGVTEMLTAAAVGRLVERGRLDLDAPVRRYVPEFPEKEWPVRTRDLLSHTAGLRPHRGEGGIFVGPSCAGDADRLARFADEPLRSRPGTERRYSTYGLSLAGAVVAAAAEEPFVDFVRRELLAPLGLDDTAPDVDARIAAVDARPYYPRLMLEPRFGVHDAPPIYPSCHLAAIGFVSTPIDLVRFGAATIDGTVLEPATVESLWTPVTLEDGTATGQGLGWAIRHVPLGADGDLVRIVGHGLKGVVVKGSLGVETVGGQVAGATTTLLLVPERRIAIAVAANVSGAESVPRLALRLSDLFARRAEGR